MKKHYNQLPQVAFSILLALSLKPRHGYEIMKQVVDDSNGKITLGPGTLYGSIKQLREENLIEDYEDAKNSRRRYYRMTDKGHKRLSSELEYYDTSVRLARQRQVLETKLEGI